MWSLVCLPSILPRWGPAEAPACRLWETERRAAAGKHLVPEPEDEHPLGLTENREPQQVLKTVKNTHSWHTRTECASLAGWREMSQLVTDLNGVISPTKLLEMKWTERALAVTCYHGNENIKSYKWNVVEFINHLRDGFWWPGQDWDAFSSRSSVQSPLTLVRYFYSPNLDPGYPSSSAGESEQFCCFAL